MKKSDLKTGMIVVTRDGLDLTVIQTDNGFNLVGNIGYISSIYNDCLKNKIDSNRDIVRCYDGYVLDLFFSKKKRTLLWELEEKETVEMTLAEVCELTGKNIKIIK